MKQKISAAALKSLQKRLTYLKTIKKKQIIKEKKQAASYGDFPYENVEYVEVERKQEMNDREIQDLGNQINSSVIMDESQKQDNQKVSYGSKVELKSLNNVQVKKLEIVSPSEIDPLKGKISEVSPLGKKLMNKKKGDKIKLRNKVYVIQGII